MDIREFYGMAQSYVVNPLGCTAQAVLETGRFASKPMMAHCNFWGIKCTRRWKRLSGACFTAKTWEDTPSGSETSIAGFASFEDAEQAFEEYESLIHRLYPVCRNNPDNVWLYLDGLQGKWATDRQYIKKLCRIVVSIAEDVGIKKMDLCEQWDAAKSRGFRTEYADAVTDALGIKEMG